MKSCMVPLFSYIFLASSGSFSQVDVLPPFRRLRAECLRVYAELLTVLALTGAQEVQTEDPLAEAHLHHPAVITMLVM